MSVVLMLAAIVSVTFCSPPSTTSGSSVPIDPRRPQMRTGHNGAETKVAALVGLNETGSREHVDLSLPHSTDAPATGRPSGPITRPMTGLPGLRVNLRSSVTSCPSIALICGG